MLPLPLPSIRRARLPIVERALRECLAALPPGQAYSTMEIVTALMAGRQDPTAHVLGSDLTALANGVPGLCEHGEPEPGTGTAAGRMIRRKRWSYRPVDAQAAALIDAAVAENQRQTMRPPLPHHPPDGRLAMIEKRIDRLEGVLTRYGYPLGEIA